MKPDEALQYLANIANDLVRTLPPSAQGPTGAACNEAFNVLAPLVNPPAEVPKPPPLRAVDAE